MEYLIEIILGFLGTCEKRSQLFQPYILLYKACHTHYCPKTPLHHPLSLKLYLNERTWNSASSTHWFMFEFTDPSLQREVNWRNRTCSQYRHNLRLRKKFRNGRLAPIWSQLQFEPCSIDGSNRLLEFLRGNFSSDWLLEICEMDL